MNSIAIIPARGGSKRLPQKNILPLVDKPLIQWTIEAAMEANVFDEVCVSSDCDEILAVATKLGVTAIKRPDEFATEQSSSSEVVEHILKTYQQSGTQFDNFTLLQPTSPLRTASHIRDAHSLFFSKEEANAVVSVNECEHSPLWCGEVGIDGEMDDFFSDELQNKRSQDLPDFYRLNGAIYIVKTECFLKSKSFIPSLGCFAYVMDASDSVDIDHWLDFKIAEVLLKEKKK